MRERTNRLAQGVLNPEVPVLSVRPENLRLSVRRGKMLNVGFHADSDSGIQLKGLVYSDDIRVRVLTDNSGGVRSRVRFTMDVRYLEVGDGLTGRLLLVMDSGEKTVPHCFTMMGQQGSKLLERLKITEDFVKVTETDREAVLRIFTYREFWRAPFLRDPERSAFCRAFVKSRDAACGMGAFLETLDAKQGDNFRAIAKIMTLPRAVRGDHVFLENQDTLLLPVMVEAQATFLLTPQCRIAPERLCDVPYNYRFDIGRSALHKDKDFGALLFRSGETEQIVPISLKAGAAERRGFVPQNQATELREGRHMLHYRHAYTLFLLTGRGEQFGGAEAALREAEHEKEIDVQRSALYTVELLAVCGSTAHTQQYLDAPDGTFSGIRVAGTKRLKTYLADSLKNLLSGDKHRKNRTVGCVERRTVREGRAGLLPMLLLLVPEYPTARAAKWEKLLKHCYRQDSRGVYLYALLTRAFQERREALADLTPASLAVLRFLLREQAMIKTVARRVVALAAETAAQQPGETLRVLYTVYERLLQRELLEVLIRDALRRRATDRTAYGWYCEVVRQDLRIPGLYEALLMSMPEDATKPLSHRLLLYFLFDNTLGEKSLVRLYRKVCERRFEEPEIWRKYRREIEDFGLRKLPVGGVSRSLAPIYEALLWNDMIDERFAAVLSRIPQAQYVAASRAEDRRLVAVYPELEEEETAGLLMGEAHLPIYSPRALLLTEDSAGNRRAPKGLERKALFDLPQYLTQCEVLQPGQPAVLLRGLDKLLQRAGEANENLNDEDVRTLCFGLRHVPLAESCKDRIRAALLTNKSHCEGYLQRSDRADFTEKERTEVSSLLVRQEKWREAYELLQEYLLREFKPGALARLVSYLMQADKTPSDELLRKLALAVFRAGKADRTILGYLAAHYDGGIGEMRSLLHAVTEQDAEPADLPTHVLAGQLFLGDRSEIRWVFACCEQQDAVERELAEAYFTVYAGKYLFSDIPLASDQARTMENYAEQMTKVSRLYACALLHYYVSFDAFGTREKTLAERFLQMLAEQDIFLPGSRQLTGKVQLPDVLFERSLFSFREEEGKRYTVEGRVLSGEVAFRRADCTKLFGRIYLRNSVPFSGETEGCRVLDAESGKVVQRTMLRESTGRTSHDSAYTRLDRLDGLPGGAEEELKAEPSAYATAHETRSELFSFDAGSMASLVTQRGAEIDAVSGN